MKIKIKIVDGGKLPSYETPGAVGADCYARIEEPVFLESGKMVTIPLGFRVEIPEGYEMQIRARSGLAKKHGIGIVNGLGTIDSDYRGEVNTILINHSIFDYKIQPGERVSQAVIAPVIRAEWEEVEELSETVRGEGGFGSTGK